MTTINFKKIVVAGAILLAVWGILIKLPSEAIVYWHNKNQGLSANIVQQNVECANKSLQDVEQQTNYTKEKLIKQYVHLLTTNGRYTEKKITNDLKIIDTQNYILPEDPKHIVANRSNPHRPDIYSFHVNQKSAITAYELELILKGTGLEGLGKSFIRAELTYNVNAVFLASLAIHESSWGNSDLSKYKNNLFGFGAYDRDPYNMAHSFSSKEECIMHVAKFLNEQYINGGYGTGGNIINIGKVYASDKNWPFKLWKTMIHIETSS